MDLEERPLSPKDGSSTATTAASNATFSASSSSSPVASTPSAVATASTEQPATVASESVSTWNHKDGAGVGLQISTHRLLWQWNHVLLEQVLWSIGVNFLRFILPPFFLELYNGSATAATMYGVFTAVSSAAEYLSLPTIGQFAQSAGRRPALLAAATGSLIGCALFFPVTSRSTVWISMIAGALEGASSGISSTNLAISADVSPPSQRSHFAGALLIMNLAIPLIVGAAMAAALLGVVAYWGLFLVVFIFVLLSLVVIVLLVPETLPPAARVAFSWKPLNPLVPLVTWLGRPFFNLAFLSYLFFSYAIGFALTFAYYYVHYRFGTAYSVYVPFALGMAVFIAIFFGLAGPLIRRFGCEACYLIGISFGLLTSIVLALADSDWTCLSFIVIGSPAALTPPSLVTLINRHAQKVEQAQFLAYMSAILLFGWFLSGLTMGPLLAVTVTSSNRWVAAACLWLCCGCFLISAALFAAASARLKKMVQKGTSETSGQIEMGNVHTLAGSSSSSNNNSSKLEASTADLIEPGPDATFATTAPSTTTACAGSLVITEETVFSVEGLAVDPSVQGFVRAPTSGAAL